MVVGLSSYCLFSSLVSGVLEIPGTGRKKASLPQSSLPTGRWLLGGGGQEALEERRGQIF